MRLIDADAKTFPTPYKYNDTKYAEGWNACLKSIQQQPTIDAEPVKHGHFEWDDEVQEYICSECGHLTAGICDMEDEITEWEGNKAFALRTPNFCKHCGAKMDEEEK